MTGGSGLVGAYAVRMLLDRGERPVVYDVAVNERLLEAVGVESGKVTAIRGDMMDLPALISALRDNDCDRIIHLAAFLGEEVQRRPYSGVRLNFMGTVNVFEAARLEKVSRMIFPSSGTVYLGSLGEGLHKIDETIPMNPPSIYAATKASCEFMGRAYAKRYGFEFICLRYTGGLYGPSPAALKATREIAIQQMIRAAVKVSRQKSAGHTGRRRFSTERMRRKAPYWRCSKTNLLTRCFTSATASRSAAMILSQQCARLIQGRTSS